MTAKRLYKNAGVAAAAGGFGITLDGRAVRTPAGSALVLPGRSLAMAIADEWSAQGEHVLPHTMPLMQLAATVIDRVAEQRQAVIDAVLQYADTDLLCYRSTTPKDLAERQATAWQPLLDWAENVHGVALRVTHGIVPVDQTGASRAALERVVQSFSDWELAALSSAAAALGSLIIALALLADEIDIAQAHRTSHLEEIFQNERWGEDAEASARRQRLQADVEAAAQLVKLVRGDDC